MNGLDFTIDAGTFGIGLLVQFVGIVWYSRGLVSELKHVIHKVEHLEVQVKETQDKVNPFIGKFDTMSSHLVDTLKEIKLDLREIRSDLKNKENIK